MAKRKPRAAAHRTPQRRAALYTSPWLLAAAFVVVALTLYWNGLRHPLVFEDRLLRDDFLKYYGTSTFRFDSRWFAYASFGWTYDVVGKQWLWHHVIKVLFTRPWRSCWQARPQLKIAGEARVRAACEMLSPLDPGVIRK